jgi:hypothetical protein
MEKDMANTDYAQYELQAKQFLKEATELLSKNNNAEATEKLYAALVELKLMKTAIKYA